LFQVKLEVINLNCSKYSVTSLRFLYELIHLISIPIKEGIAATAPSPAVYKVSIGNPKAYQINNIEVSFE